MTAFNQLPAFTSNAYYLITAPVGGGAVTLGVQSDGSLACQNAAAFGQPRQAKWLLTKKDGYWLMRTASPVLQQVMGGEDTVSLTMLDYAGGASPTLAKAIAQSPAQQWAITQEGASFRIRPFTDGDKVLVATNGGAPTLQGDYPAAPAGSAWTLTQTSAT